MPLGKGEGFFEGGQCTGGLSAIPQETSDARLEEVFFLRWVQERPRSFSAAVDRGAVRRSSFPVDREEAVALAPDLCYNIFKIPRFRTGPGPGQGERYAGR